VTEGGSNLVSNGWRGGLTSPHGKCMAVSTLLVVTTLPIVRIDSPSLPFSDPRLLAKTLIPPLGLYNQSDSELRM